MVPGFFVALKGQHRAAGGNALGTIQLKMPPTPKVSKPGNPSQNPIFHIPYLKFYIFVAVLRLFPTHESVCIYRLIVVDEFGVLIAHSLGRMTSGERTHFPAFGQV